MHMPTIRQIVLICAALLAVLSLTACDTTPLSAGEGEGELIVEVRSPETATGDFKIDWSPQPERSGALTRRGNTYHYLEVPAGTYELTVTQSGAQPETTTVTVAEGEESRHVIELEPAQ